MTRKIKHITKVLSYFLIVSFLVGCDNSKVVEPSLDYKSSEQEEYPYANSTDIFVVKDNICYMYDLNGKNQKILDGKIADGCIIKVTDEWLYYKVERTETIVQHKDIEAIIRIPLTKGEDGRSLSAGKKENVVDQLNGVTSVGIVGDYVVYVRSALCVNYNNHVVSIRDTQENDEIFSVNMKNNQKNKCLFPQSITSKESEEWKMIDYYKHKTIWKGDYSFIYDIDSNSITPIVNDEAIGITCDVDLGDVFYCNDEKNQNLKKIHIEDNKETVVLKREYIKECIVNCMGVLLNDMIEYEIENNYYHKGKVYLSLKIKINKNYNRYILLSYDTKKDVCVYERELDNVKHLYSAWNETSENMILMGCVYENWFFLEGEHILSGSGKILKYNENKKEITICNYKNNICELFAKEDLFQLDERGIYEY